MIFTSNFQTAISPQLMMNTSQKEFGSAKKLFVSGSKLSFILLCMLGIPVMAETHYILNLWLGEVPDYSIVFCQIMIVISIWSCLDNPIRVVNQAEGNIRKFQLYECTLLLLIVPISYLALKLYLLPTIVFYVHLVVELFAQIVRLRIVLPKINMNFKEYIQGVYLRIAPVFFLPILSYYIINSLFDYGLNRVIFNVSIIELLIVVLSFAICFNKQEKELILSFLRNKIKKQ